MKFHATVYILCLAFIVSCAAPIQKQDPLGYEGFKTEGESVEAALNRLKMDPGIKIRVESGWTIASDESNGVIWSFTPDSHESHPSMVKRTVFEEGGEIFIKTDVKCSAEKEICDNLVKEFIDLNNKIREQFSDEKET